MNPVRKLLAFLLLALTGILYLLCTFLVHMSATILYVFMLMALMVSVFFFIGGKTQIGITYLALAFMISPYGLPALAAVLAEQIGAYHVKLKTELFG